MYTQKAKKNCFLGFIRNLLLLRKQVNQIKIVAYKVFCKNVSLPFPQLATISHVYVAF